MNRRAIDAFENLMFALLLLGMCIIVTILTNQ